MPKKQLACPLFLVLLLGIGALFAILVLENLLYPFNGTRLLPSVGLLAGYRLYYPIGAGPLIPRSYSPLGLVAHLPIALFRDPNYAVIAGELWSIFLVFGASIFFLIRARGSRVPAAYSFVYLCLGVLSSASALTCVIWIHVDAPMLAMLLLACGALLHDDSSSERRNGFIAGVLFSATMYTKQVGFFSVFGAFAVLAFYGHWKKLWPLACGWVLTTFALLVFFLVRYGFDAISYQWVIHQFRFVFSRTNGEAAVEAAMQWFPPIALTLILLISGGLRRAKDLPFTVAVPLTVAAALSFISFWSFRKSYADINSFGAATYLLWLAGAGALQFFLTNSGENKRRWVIAVVGLFVWETALGRPIVQRLAPLSAYFHNSTYEAYLLARRFPGSVYVPYHPLSTFLVDRKIYHFAPDIHDRVDMNEPFTEEHFRSYLPEKLKYVVITPDAKAFMKPSDPLFRYLPEFKVRVKTVGYPDWLILTNEPLPVPSSGSVSGE